MSKVWAFLLVAGVLIATPKVSNAAITDAFDYSGTQLNEVFFTNLEVIIRADASSSFGGLAGYREVTGTAGDPLADGDLLIQIYNAQNLEVGASEAWIQAGNDRFQAYGVQEVVDVDTHGTTTHVTFGAASVDPFGKLNVAAGETIRFYVDTGATALDASGTLANGVNSVTDGVVWASFGLAPASDGLVGGTPYFYSHPATSATQAEGDAFVGLNVILGPSNGAVFLGVNDPNESELGNGLTSLYGSAEFEINPNGPFGTNANLWRYRSNDPVAFLLYVPEPATMTIWGAIASFGAVGAFLRRRKNLKA